jgi:hypothetical protein
MVMKTIDLERSMIALAVSLIMISCGNATQVKSTEKATPHILSFQLTENKDSKNESKIEVSTCENLADTTKTKNYKYTGKTLLEIYQLISQDIPESKFIISDTLIDAQTKLLSQRFDLEMQATLSPETEKEIFQKLDAVSGFQTNISKVVTDIFLLKEIKENTDLKKIKINNRKTFVTKKHTHTITVQDNVIYVNGEINSDNWLSLIKKEFNMLVELDKSLDNNWYQVKNLTIKKNLHTVDEQLIILREAGFIIERKSGETTVINVK